MTEPGSGESGSGESGGSPSLPDRGSEPALPRQVLIIGSGLIGTSLGLALSARGVAVAVTDTDPKVLRESVARGAGRLARDDDDPDLVVVAVPPSAVVDQVVGALSRYPNAVVIDVASSKTEIVRGVSARNTDRARFVGTHPMAGREVAGPAGADADLFEDRPWVITATSQTDPHAVVVADAVARACGAVVMSLSPQAHDRAAALTSHAPQLVASALAAQLAAAPAQDVVIAGQGLRDTTRIADSDPRLWVDILATNATQVVPVIDRVVADLQAAAASLRAASESSVDADSGADGGSGAATGAGSESGSESSPGAGSGEIAALLRRGNLGRARLPAKHGGAAKSYSVVGVVLADEPGQLSRLFAAAGDAGVNLEDVHIDHSVGRLNALVELSVLPENESMLAAALRAGGWRLRGQ